MMLPAIARCLPGRLSAGALALAALAAPLSLRSQAVADDVVRLETFTISADQDNGYRANNSISATKVATEIRNLPVVLNVITPEFLQDLKPASIQQALQYAPGVMRSGNTTFNGFNLRGFPTDYLQRDGWRVWRNPPTETVDRVEIVKGPLAILFGNQISPGGAINFITKQPQARAETAVMAAYSSFGNVLGVLDSTGPVDRNGRLLYRFVGSAKSGNNWFDLEQIRDRVVAPAFTWRPTDSVEVSLSYEDSRKKRLDAAHSGMAMWFGPDGQGSKPWDWVFFNTKPGVVGVHPNAAREMNADGPGSLVDSHIKSGVGRVTVRVADFLTVRAQVNYVDDDLLRIYAANLDTEVTSPLGAKPGDANFNTISGRNGTGLTRTLNHLHNYDNWFGQMDLLWKFDLGPTRHQLITGYEYSEGGYRGYGYNPPAGSPTYTYDLLTRQYTGAFPAAYTQFYQFANSWGQGNAVYGTHQMTVGNGRLHTLAGLRYDESGGANRGVNITNHDYLVSPQLGAVVRLTDAVRLFAGYSKLLRSNGQVNGVDLDPQSGEGLEFGLRADLLEGRFSTTVSYFDISRDKIRSYDVSAPPYPLTLIGLQTGSGIEIEGSYSPTPDLQFVGSVVFLETETEGSTNLPDTNGLERPNAPNEQATFFAKYTFREGRAHGLSIFGGASYVGGGRLQYSPGFGSVGSGLGRTFVLGAYTVVDVGASYDFKVGGVRYTAGLNVRNLLDEFYVVNTNAAGEPREIVFSLRAAF